jgi:site-specific DNA-methyltransferase (adenine-specific)
MSIGPFALNSVICSDWIEFLRQLPDESVQCCVTSPPYLSLRDYGIAGQLGLEPTMQEYIEKLVLGFREVRRVLRSDGTLWLNLGDSYSNDTKWGGKSGGKNYTSAAGGYQGQRVRRNKDCDPKRGPAAPGQPMYQGCHNLKPKDLCMIPARVALALQADGWYLRQDIIWAKPNPMPESVTDRCTKAHEYLFLLTKSERYYCDMDAIKERCLTGDNGSSYTSSQDVATKKGLGQGPRKIKIPGGWDTGDGGHGTIHRDGRTSAEYAEAEVSPFRNKRSVWNVST